MNEKLSPSIVESARNLGIEKKQIIKNVQSKTSEHKKLK